MSVESNSKTIGLVFLYTFFFQLTFLAILLNGILQSVTNGLGENDSSPKIA